MTGPRAKWLALFLGTVAASCTSARSTPPPAPVASITPQSLDFGTQPVGQATAAKGMTLSNTGNAPLAISSIAVTGDYSQVNDCGSSLAVGSDCTIEVTFDPRANGVRPGSLSIADDAGGSPHTVAVTGSGAAIAPGSTPTLVQHVASTSQPVTGAATSPIGVSAGHMQTVCDNDTTLTDYPAITPGAANGLTIAACELGQGPGRGFASGSPAGAIWDFVNYDDETDVSTMNNADCRGHLYTSSTAQQHWNWTIKSNPSNSCDAAAVHLLQ